MRVSGIVCAAVLVAIVGTGCSPTAAAPTTAAIITPSPAPATASPAPTPSPTPPPATLTWVAPGLNARITTAAVTFKATFDGGSAPASVTFTAKSGSTTKTACAAKAAATTWSCTANLLALGVSPGQVTLGVRTVDAAGVTAAHAADTRPFVYAVAPLPPANGTYKEVAGANYVVHKTVSWKGALLGATAVSVYGLSRCLAPEMSTDKPCIVKGTKLAPRDLFRIATTTPDRHSVTWDESYELLGDAVGWRNDELYYGILLVAENQYGRSRFVILASAVSCADCVY